MGGLLELVDESDRVIFVGNAALAVGGGEKLVAAKAEFAGALARADQRGRRKKRPVEVLFAPQKLEKRAARTGFRLVGFRKTRRVDQLLSRRHFQASGAANDEITRHAGLLYCRDQKLRIGGGETHRANDGIVAREQRRECFLVVHVTGLGRDTRPRRYLLRMPRYGSHGMAARQQLGEHATANISARSNRSDFHNVLSPTVISNST